MADQAMEELLSASECRERLLTLLWGADFTESDKLLWEQELKREQDRKSTLPNFLDSIFFKFEDETKTPMERLSLRPLEHSLLKHLSTAKVLISKAECVSAKCILDVIVKICNRWSTILDQEEAKETMCGHVEWLSTCLEECASLLRLCEKAFVPTDTPRQRHLTHLLAVQKFFEPLGPQKVPRMLTWSFLRNPWSLMALSDNHISIVRLQTGREIQRINHSMGDASFPLFVALFKISRGPHQTLSGAAMTVALQDSSSEPPIEANRLIVDTAEAGFTKLNLFWCWSGNKLQQHCTPVATAGPQVMIQGSPRKQVFLRAGFVAISEQHNWFACWVQSGANLLTVCDVVSGKCHVLEELALSGEFDSWEIFMLAVSGNLLFAGNDAEMKVYSITRNGHDVTGSLLASQSFELFRCYTHIEDFHAQNGFLAILHNANLDWSHPAFESRVDVFPADKIDFSRQPIQQIHGSFAGMELAGDYIITFNLQAVVEVWPCEGSTCCLMRLDDFGTLIAVLATNKDIHARFCQLKEHLPHKQAEGDCEALVVSDEHWSEDAVVISPAEASRVAEELWATGVVDALQLPSPFVPSIGIEGGSDVILLTFDRCTRELEDALLACPPAVAASKRGHDVKPDWAGGAKIFVEGVTAALFEAPTFDGELRPWHVVVRDVDEEAVVDALNHLPIRYKKMKTHSGRIQLPGSASLLNVSEEEGEEYFEQSQTSEHEPSEQEVIPYRIVRTFIDVEVPRLKDPRSAQSA